MSYTKEPFVDGPKAQVQPDIIREERTVDPYKSVSRSTQDLGQRHSNETTQDAVTKPVAENVALSPQMAALARREQQARRQEQELKSKSESIAKAEAEIAEYKALKEKLAAKDYSALDPYVNYNDYTQHQVDRLNGTDPVKEELKKMADEINGMKKSQEESTNKLFEAAVAERRTAVKNIVEKDPKFSGIKQLKLEEAVVQHLLDTWEEDSIELSPEEAAREVQEELLARAKRMAAIIPAEQPVDSKRALPPMKPGLKTITNQVTAGDLNTPRKSLRGMNDSERWAEARRRAEAKLQQRG